MHSSSDSQSTSEYSFAMRRYLADEDDMRWLLGSQDGKTPDERPKRIVKLFEDAEKVPGLNAKGDRHKL